MPSENDITFDYKHIRAQAYVRNDHMPHYKEQNHMHRYILIVSERPFFHPETGANLICLKGTWAIRPRIGFTCDRAHRGVCYQCFILLQRPFSSPLVELGASAKKKKKKLSIKNASEMCGMLGKLIVTKESVSLRFL